MLEFMENIAGIELFVQAEIHERPRKTPDDEPDEGWEVEIECVWVYGNGAKRISVDWESLAYMGEDLNEILIDAAIEVAKQEDE